MTNTRTSLLLALAIFHLCPPAPGASAAGIDYSAPYCAKPKAHMACTPEGSVSRPPKDLTPGRWPTRSIPFVFGNLSGSGTGAEAMKAGIRAALLDMQSHSDLTFYECTDEAKLRSYFANVTSKDAIKTAYLIFSWKHGECENDSIGYPANAVYLDVDKGGPQGDVVGKSQIRLGRYDCSEVQPMGIAHEVLHSLGFYHNFESPKTKAYFTPAPVETDSKYLKIVKMLSTSVAGRAFSKTEFDYFSLLGSPVERPDGKGGSEVLYYPTDKYKLFVAEVKKRYGIEIYYKLLQSNKGPISGVDTDRHFGQNLCLSAGDAEKLDIIYGSNSGLKCDAFNVSAAPNCMPLK